MSPVRLMGIGARLGHTPRVQDAYGSADGDVHLRGSVISVCTTDGKQPGLKRYLIPR